MPKGYPKECLKCEVEVKDRPYHILPKLKEEWEHYQMYKEGIRYFNEVAILFFLVFFYTNDFSSSSNSFMILVSINFNLLILISILKMKDKQSFDHFIFVLEHSSTYLL